MKTIKRKMGSIVALTILLMTFLFTGCKKNMNEGMEEIRFAINAMHVEKPNDGLKSGTVDLSDRFSLKSANPDEVTHVRVVIDNSPTLTFTIPYSAEVGITDPIRLPVGDHTLTSMLLLRETTVGSGEYQTIFSAVQQGADLSQYVTVTLPLAFHIPLLQQTAVPVDVVAIDDWTPNAFGWGRFDLSFVSLNPMYFYGADAMDQPSVMSMSLYDDNGVLLSNSTLEPEGWIKIYVPDYYGIENPSEVYTLMLIKDGIEYMRTYTVEEILALPREVILLNVYGSGMAGFTEVLTLNSVMFSMPNSFAPSGDGERFGFTVRNDNGIIVYQSAVTQGVKSFNYKNTIIADNTEFYDITLTYQLWENGAGVWNNIQTRVARVNVFDLMNMSMPISMGLFGSPSNNYWLFN